MLDALNYVHGQVQAFRAACAGWLGLLLVAHKHGGKPAVEAVEGAWKRTDAETYGQYLLYRTLGMVF